MLADAIWLHMVTDGLPWARWPLVDLIDPLHSDPGGQ